MLFEKLIMRFQVVENFSLQGILKVVVVVDFERKNFFEEFFQLFFPSI